MVSRRRLQHLSLRETDNSSPDAQQQYGAYPREALPVKKDRVESFAAKAYVPSVYSTRAPRTDLRTTFRLTLAVNKRTKDRTKH